MMPAPGLLRSAMLGTLVALAALLMAVLVAGPALRSLAGPPAGFGSDYTSAAAYVQAVVAQGVSLALVDCRAGVWLLRLSRADERPHEYTAYHGWLLLAVSAPVLFAPCIYIGARLIRRHP